MGSYLLVSGLSFFTCFIIAAFLFSALCKIPFLRDNLLSSSFAVVSSIIVVVLPISIMLWYPYDLVSDITLWQYLASLLSVLLIFASLFFRNSLATVLGVILAATSAVLISGIDIAFFPAFPLWLNQLIAIAALVGFSFGWRCLCGLTPLPQIEGITISGGLFILALLGFAPFILGLSSSAILGAFTAAYLYGAKHPLSINSAPLIGFIFGWLGLIAYGEYLLPCFLIFALFYLAELIISLSKKCLPLSRHTDMAYNTVSLTSFSEGLPAAILLRILWSSNLLLLIFGILQIHGNNIYSLLAFSAIVTFWQLYRLANWQQSSAPAPSIKSALRNWFNSDKNNQDKS